MSQTRKTTSRTCKTTNRTDKMTRPPRNIYTSGIFTGAMALNLKDGDNKGQGTITKNGRNDRGLPAFYSVTA